MPVPAAVAAAAVAVVDPHLASAYTSERCRHCKRKTPTYSRYIQKDLNMTAICRQLANSTLKLANSTEAALK